MKNYCFLATLSLCLSWVLPLWCFANSSNQSEAAAGVSQADLEPSNLSDKPNSLSEPTAVPCVHVGDTHILKVPVTVNGTVKTYFILDTGAGVNLISKSLANKLGMKVRGSYRGKRMSGQAIDIEMSKASALSIGAYSRNDLSIGLWDMQKLFENEPQFADIQGIVSLNYFKNCAVTIDYSKNQVIIETDKSLSERAVQGSVIPIKVKNKNGMDTSVMFSMQLSKKLKANMEVDTGSGAMILDTRYMKLLGVDANAKSVKKVIGKDETNHSYTRYFTKLEQITIHPSGAPSVSQSNPPAQFQDIIYDGLVGDDFLRNFIVTYDLPNSRMIFSKK